MHSIIEGIDELEAVKRVSAMKPRATVFVVDDDAFMRLLLKRLFTDAGMRVRTFASAADVLADPDLASPCVLLVDVQMPQMSGLELQLVLREREIRAPLIFLTAQGDVPMAVTAMRNGAVDFLEKPFDAAALIERVQRAFERRVSPPRRRVEDGLSKRLESLTPREHEVLDLMVTGVSSKHIARSLGGSFRTIEIHRARIMAKMAAASLAHLVRMVIDAAPPQERHA